MIGKSLSHFRITAKLGEGGMGEVYRAVDTTLDREVAIKVLPEELTSDPERLARFEREAKVLAALNHPNIAGIHQIAEADGKRLLVMELVEGEDLAERLTRGPLSVEEAAPIALQVAEGLEAAHERGIVHRDLKPANVRITPDGQAKILDFGLAKAWEGRGAADSGLSASPTLTAQMTQAGMILGTAAYMSPEQARGQEADRRSDVWSFGVLLYEMLTGSRLFQGDTVSDTLARVLLAEVDWNELDADLPAPLSAVLHRCLERDPRSRLQAIGEARYRLETWLADPRRGESAAARTADRSGSSRRNWLPWAIAALAAVVATWAWMGRQPSPRNAASSAVAKFRLDGVASPGRGAARGLAISPAGDRIVVLAPGRLVVREIDSLQPRLLVDGLTDSEPAPFWSPDGAWVGYTDDGRLWKVPSEGGAPSVVSSVQSNFVGAAWGADDRIVYVLTRGDMYEVSARGGDPRLLLERVPGEDVDFHVPTYLPDGHSFLYAVHRPAGVDTLEVFDGSERRVIYRLEGQQRSDPQVLNDPVYSPTGHVLYRRGVGDRGLWALPFSLERIEATGQPFLVAAEGAWPTVSADGRRLVFARAAEALPAQLVRVRTDGSAPMAIGEPMRQLREPAVSADGELIAFVAEVGSNMELFLMDLEGRQVRLTTTPEAEGHPSFTADGQTLFFERGTGEGTAVFSVRVDGSGIAEKLVDFAGEPHISAGGRYVAFDTNSREIMGVGAFDLETGEETLVVVSGSDFASARLSPDERVLAYTGWETGQARVTLRGFPSGTTSQIVPESDQSDLQWSDDGRTLYYRSFGGAIHGVNVVSHPSLLVGQPEVVFDPSTLESAGTLGEGLGIFPDGSFLMTRHVGDDGRLGDIILVENWFEEFR